MGLCASKRDKYEPGGGYEPRPKQNGHPVQTIELTSVRGPNLNHQPINPSLPSSSKVAFPQPVTRQPYERGRFQSLAAPPIINRPDATIPPRGRYKTMV
ncbi:uncharacterized protein EI90DRAFT_3065164 [Cantharellus anzutake]|uniref:uncharacterized protein n=1 Tax=Cantharellus anzutake TaxID=1750568 RepID=UPI00190772F9|nr:uncharacterized protein EI90DRAFT_3065164 [Cantharellus anzutake]KAF8328414.1 hypothetical protein EI90DRAFT_3065164 [Cantharellus anzutake]